MDNNMDMPGMGGPVRLLVALWMNILFWVDQRSITFFLSTTATCLAITYYIMQINKMKRENKKNNQAP